MFSIIRIVFGYSMSKCLLITSVTTVHGLDNQRMNIISFFGPQTQRITGTHVKYMHSP